MRSRHRIPTIFNLYMIDVLCCSLGSAIMLWLLNLHDAKELGEKAGQTRALLNETQSRLDDTSRQAEALRGERERLSRQADDLSRELASARTRQEELNADLAKLQGEYAASEERLARKTKEQQ